MTLSSSRVFLKRFKFSGNTAFVLEFGHQYIRFYADHGQVLNNGAVYEIASPYTFDDLWDENEKVCKLQITQNADVLYLWHKKYMKTLTRYGNTDWRLADFELKGGPWENKNTNDSLTISASAETGSVTLTASGDVFGDGDVGRLYRLNLFNDNTTPWAASKSVSVGNIMTSDGHYYRAASSGTTGTIKPVHTEGTRSDGAVNWEYIHSGYGVVKITAVSSATSATATVQDRLPASISTADWERGLIYSGSEKPVAGTFFKNRLAILLNTKEGLKCLLSQSDDFDNFADKDFGEVVTTCAITAPVLSNEYNEGRWLSAGDVLFIGTNNGEFYLDNMTSGEALGPENCKVSPISNIGSKAIQPVKINGHTLFVDKFGTSIRDLIYSYERDGYDPFDATIKGKHLLKSGIVDWEFQDYPDKILWCITEEGKIVGFTFNTEQEVTALHQHHLSGAVESLTVIPSPSENKDDLWVAVRRTINGVSNRMIEWVDEGRPLEYPYNVISNKTWDEREKDEAEYDKQNAWYVDSGVVFKRSAGDASTTISGLGHLAGKQVAIMADGAELPRQTVSDQGTITVSKYNNNIVIGLPVLSVFKAKKRYLQGNATAGVGEVQRIDHLTLMLYRSGGGQVGNSFDNLIDILYRKTDAVMGQSAPLFTGNKVITMPGRTSTMEEKGADILIVNESVYPMTVLAISPQMVQSES